MASQIFRLLLELFDDDDDPQCMPNGPNSIPLGLFCYSSQQVPALLPKQKLPMGPALTVSIAIQCHCVRHDFAAVGQNWQNMVQCQQTVIEVNENHSAHP